MHIIILELMHFSKTSQIYLLVLIEQMSVQVYYNILFKLDNLFIQ